MKFHLVDLCSIRILSCISNSHASRKGLRSHTTKKHGTRSHRKADDDESQTVGGKHAALIVTYIQSQRVFFLRTAPCATADSLEYTINPGARINSSLLYTIDEKQIYRRRTVGDTADRYVCNANVKPACRVALNVSKPGGIARKVTGRREHTHGSQEEQYLKNQFVSAVKTDLMKSCGDSLVRPKDVFAKRLAM